LYYLDDAVLRRKAGPVAAFGEAEQALVQAMAALMVAHRGVGLAAPQVGILQRVVVIHPGLLPPGADTVLVNPEVVHRSREKTEEEEGCLSLLSVAVAMPRPARVAVRYRDLGGREREVEASDFGARALIHEIEHLDGILFIDHLSRLKRKAVTDRFRKLYRELGLEVAGAAK
jgi:peptide deformylase